MRSLELPENILSSHPSTTLAGFIEISEESEEDQDSVEHLIQCIEGLDDKEAENDVRDEMAFLLCRPCRNRFGRNPLNKPGCDIKSGERHTGILH